MKIGINTSNIEKLTSGEVSERTLANIINPVPHVKKCIEAGFRHFELSCDANFMYSDDLNRKSIKELNALKEQHKLTFSVHLPFRGVELSYPSSELTKAYAVMLACVIDTVKPLEPEAYTIHVSGELCKKFRKLPAQSYVIRHLISYSEEVLKRLLDITKVPSRLIAVENLKFPFEALEGMIEKLELGICMDAGHVTAGYSGEHTVLEFLDRYYDRIAEIHLHDAYKRRNENDIDIRDHIALGQGDLNYIEFISELYKRGYKGPIILEMKKFDHAVDSLKKLISECGEYVKV